MGRDPTARRGGTLGAEIAALTLTKSHLLGGRGQLSDLIVPLSPPQWYASQGFNACGEPNHQVTRSAELQQVQPTYLSS